MNAPVAGLAGGGLHPWSRARAAEFNQRYATAPSLDLLRAALIGMFRGRIAVVSSFGTESAVLLHMTAKVDRATPVIFLDTGQLFAQTLQYVEQLSAHLGLTDVRVQHPDSAAIAAEDSQGDLWRHDPDRCCYLRKVLPLENALAGFDAWISGRKRFQGGRRGTLPLAEAEGGRVKLNPLASWSAAAIDEYFGRYGLPRHPLQEFGFLSIGCQPCTDPASPGTTARSGRWAGTEKTECGIHRAPPPRRRVQIGTDALANQNSPL